MFIQTILEEVLARESKFKSQKLEYMLIKKSLITKSFNAICDIKTNQKKNRKIRLIHGQPITHRLLLNVSSVAVAARRM